MFNQFYYFFLSTRPNQIVKNVIIFLPLIFSGSLFYFESFIMSLLGFFAFYILSGATYILNDIKDIKYDKKHPKKSKRPIVSGKLNLKIAFYLSIVLILISLIFTYFLLGKIVFFLFILYLINTLIYTYYVKNIVILDVFFLSFGFIIRGLIGIYLINTDISIWFLLILFFVALFFGFLKRYQEFKLSIFSRKNIFSFNEEFLKQIIFLLTTLIIISYSLYTFNSIQSKLFSITIPFVLFGILRYLYNIFYLKENIYGVEEIIFKDKFILIDILLYFFIVLVIIYIL